MATPNTARIPLQSLPRFSKGWTFLYVEHARIDKEDNAILVRDIRGAIPVPSASLSVLLLGPGSTITHEAMKTLADCGCSAVWCGEGAVRCYASGLGETRQASNLMHQASAWADPVRHLEVVHRMYRMRFSESLPEDLSLEQIRGREGVRVRDAYARASQRTGVPWSGRRYNPGDWGAADPVNKALSTASSCLYGLCHAAILSTGFSPGLGFVHTGKMMSFVYDIADLYKVDVTVPIAFEAAAEGDAKSLSQRVRHLCRDAFREKALIARIVPDMQVVLGLKPEKARLLEVAEDPESELGLGLWDPSGVVPGGVNHGDPESLN